MTITHTYTGSTTATIIAHLCEFADAYSTECGLEPDAVRLLLLDYETRRPS